MGQLFGAALTSHEHVAEPDDRFSDGTGICTICVGRAFLMAAFGGSEAVNASRVNELLDEMRAKRP